MSAPAVDSPALIPEPRRLPLLGSLVGDAPSLDPQAPVQSMIRLARELGPIYRLTFPGHSILVLSSHALAAEVCDERRFAKKLHGPLEHLRDFAGDGLFTAQNDEPNWGKAHRLLVPAFGGPAMRQYFAGMFDIADQMLAKWERLGPDENIDVADAFTRLTLDTVALCGFSFRFNSFYQREMHPFVQAMVRGLAEASGRARRLPIQTQLMFATQRRYRDDVRVMNELTDRLIAKRRALPAEEAPRDLLGLMLTGRDPETGEGLDDVNIRNQLVTFLVAGHETTSGLLSFATHLLLAHPEVLRRAQAEVDAVLGSDPPRFEQLRELTGIDGVLRETLRLYPTAPAFALEAKGPTSLAGRYRLQRGDVVFVLLPALHRDPSVWSDPDRFDPGRFAPDRRAAIPPKAWMPFGHGMRACLGRAFALQEATLALAMILQRFDISAPGPYTLKIKETLTLKPDGLLLRARRRGVRRPT